MSVLSAKELGLTVNHTSTGGYTFSPEIQGQMVDTLPEEAIPVVIYLMDTEKEAVAFVEGLRAGGVPAIDCCTNQTPEPFKGLYAVIRQIDEDEYIQNLIEPNDLQDGDIPVIDMRWINIEPKPVKNRVCVLINDGGMTVDVMADRPDNIQFALINLDAPEDACRAQTYTATSGGEIIGSTVVLPVTQPFIDLSEIFTDSGKEQETAPIVSERFAVNAKGDEVTDTKTGLVWKRCREGQTFNGEICAGKRTQFTWDEAVEYAAAQPDGWRLPTIEEFHTLFEGNKPKEGLFPDKGGAWSGSPYSAKAGAAWVVYFDVGNAGPWLTQDNTESVRLVRVQ